MTTSEIVNLMGLLGPWIILGLTVWALFRPGSSFSNLCDRMVTMATAHGSKNALAYLIGVCLVLGATFTSFYDNFGNIDRATWLALGWWQILALLAKSLASAPAALVGYLMRSPIAGGTGVPGAASTLSSSPFPPPSVPPVNPPPQSQ